MPSRLESTAAPTVSVEDLPAAPELPTHRAPGAVTSTRPSASVETSTFHEELALVEGARSALARGDGHASLQTLDRYDARFRAGVLVSEADITRIEALTSVGRIEEARALADRFLARQATSPYAERVRSLRTKLGAAEKDTGQ
ncbi:MAG: hypothetical protein K0S65_3502 [Labilithrix sp.]|nr:hypothetical protein [Labilithrix sp.]